MMPATATTTAAPGGVLAGFMPITSDGEAIAPGLYETLRARQEEAGIVDLWWYGISVEMALANGEHWAVECIGPDAFRLYPGVTRDNGVIWLNVWVRRDYTLVELASNLDDVLAAAKRKTSQ
jgi:hypothetical protein